MKDQAGKGGIVEKRVATEGVILEDICFDDSTLAMALAARQKSCTGMEAGDEIHIVKKR